MRQLLQVVGLSLVLTIILSVFAANTVSLYSVPRDMTNSSQWTEFASDVSVCLQATDTSTRIVLLMSLHIMHIYICLPMIHITKVLYGFWLGVGVGWSICCVWELVLFYAYARFVRRERHDAILKYSSTARRDGTLLRENMIMAVSSLPLQAAASLLQFGDVTTGEFMMANTIVTTVMSMKNVVCGAVLASSPSTEQLVLLASVLALSAVVPTLSTVYVSSMTVLTLVQTHWETVTSKQLHETGKQTDNETKLINAIASGIHPPIISPLESTIEFRKESTAKLRNPTVEPPPEGIFFVEKQTLLLPILKH